MFIMVFGNILFGNILKLDIAYIGLQVGGCASSRNGTHRAHIAQCPGGPPGVDTHRVVSQNIAHGVLVALVGLVYRVVSRHIVVYRVEGFCVMHHKTGLVCIAFVSHTHRIHRGTSRFLKKNSRIARIERHRAHSITRYTSMSHITQYRAASRYRTHRSGFGQRCVRYTDAAWYLVMLGDAYCDVRDIRVIFRDIFVMHSTEKDPILYRKRPHPVGMYSAI